MAMAMEEDVDEQDRDEVDPDGDDAEEEEAEPSPALRLLIEAKKALTFALDRCVIEVYAADTAPEPYDQNLLYGMLDLVKEIDDLSNLAASYLGHRMAYYSSLVDPPGYPKGTLRFDPYPPEQVKRLREKLLEQGDYNRFNEVAAREGVILYCWQEGATEGKDEDGPMGFILDLIEIVEASQAGGTPLDPGLLQMLGGIVESGALGGMVERGELSQESCNRLRQLVERPAGASQQASVERAAKPQQTAIAPPGPTPARKSEFVPFAVRPRVEPSPPPARPPGRGDRFNAKKERTHDGNNKAD